MHKEWEQQKVAYTKREPLTSASMELGRVFEPFQFPITADAVSNLVRTTGSADPLYEDAAAAKREGYQGPIAPQAFAMVYGRLSFLGEKYRPAPGAIVAGITFKFARPARAGDVITSHARVTASEEKKGRKYTTVRAESKNQNGELVSTMDFTFILPA